MIQIEIAAHTIDSALAAAAGGADRVELFSDPGEGGVTPSHGAIALTREKLGIDLHVLIRPRAGDFCYSDDELQIMLRDIAVAKQLGANGIVFGIVNPDGEVALEHTRQLVDATRPLAVTFHRAFDLCRDLSQALEDVISCGVDRVLTSGGQASAMKGIETLANLVRIAGSRIGIIAAGGIRPKNAREIVQRSGVSQVHAGLRSTIPSPMRFQNLNVAFGQVRASEYERVVVTERNVRKLVLELKNL
jgi:copper homeostasis protein